MRSQRRAFDILIMSQENREVVALYHLSTSAFEFDIAHFSAYSMHTIKCSICNISLNIRIYFIYANWLTILEINARWEIANKMRCYAKHRRSFKIKFWRLTIFLQKMINSFQAAIQGN